MIWRRSTRSRPSCATPWPPRRPWPGRASSSSPAASTNRPTSSTRRSPACSASTSSRHRTSSCARAGCGCGRSAGSIRSTSSTAVSPTLAVDPIEVSASDTSSGVPGLLFAAAEGGVVLANAHGCGVVEDPVLAPYWPAAVEALTGSRLRLPMLASGRRLADAPAFRDGLIGRAHVVVRLHAVAGPDAVTVMAGGNGRVLGDGDDPRRPTARLAKDVWVLGADRAGAPVVAPLPQVDLVSSVPDPGGRRDVLARSGRRAGRGGRQDGPGDRLPPPDRPVAGDVRRWPLGARGWPTCCVSQRGEPLDVAAVDGRPVDVLDHELAAAHARRERAPRPRCSPRPARSVSTCP